MNNKQKAFTLIELLVVIAIIGVLASIVLVNLRGSKDKAKLAKTLSFAQSVHNALGAYAVGYWNFNKGTGSIAYDSSGYGNNGTLKNGPAWTTSTPSGTGYAINFDGVDDYVDVPNSASLNPNSDDFTISVWFKLNSTGSLNGHILYNKENLYEMSAGGGYVTYAWRPHWAWDGGSSFPINVGEWYQVVLVYDHVKQYLYKNGVLVYSRAQAGDIGSNSNRFALATRGISGGGNSAFDGKIDDVAIYTQALSLAQIQKLYAEGAAERGLALITDH